MVLESTIVCVDNSEFSRNGDFAPSRFACQVDSVNMLCQAKMASNVESSVGLLTLAGRSARILITSTRDPGRIFTCMHDVDYDGHADMVAGIKKAQLALKHRQNPLQRQRIVVFVSSPIDTTVEALVRLGKLLKKNSVAVDVVNIGSEGTNNDKIDAFIQAVNSNDNSHALHVQAGGGITLADAVMSSDIVMEEDMGAGGAGAAGAVSGTGGTGGEFGGLDESGDPELEMALRISMEEERARQAAARAAEEQEQQQNVTTQNSTEGTTAAAGAAAGEGEGEGDGEGDGEEGDKGEQNASGSGSGSASGKYDEDDGDLYGTGGENMDVDYADEEAEMLRRAIELSNQEAQAAEQEEAAQSSSAAEEGQKEDDDKDKKPSS